MCLLLNSLSQSMVDILDTSKWLIPVLDLLCSKPLNPSMWLPISNPLSLLLKTAGHFNMAAYF